MTTLGKASKEAIAAMRKSIPSPLGHTVTGFDAQFNPVIECNSMARATELAHVTHVREYMSTKNHKGKFVY